MNVSSRLGDEFEDDDGPIEPHKMVHKGKYKGKTAAYILLKYPDYAYWMMTRHPAWDLSVVFCGLVLHFDLKPFNVKCARCKRLATRATAYCGTGELQGYWCDRHEPAHQRRVSVVKTFEDAMRHVVRTCAFGRAEKRAIVRELARAKGLPKDFTDRESLAFFPVPVPRRKRRRPSHRSLYPHQRSVFDL